MAVAVGVGVSALSAPASAAPRPVGSLGTATALGLSGVSPHADLMEDESVRLYFPSPQTGGTAVATCTLAGNCSIVGSIERAADLTYVVLTDGSRRAYFVYFFTDTASNGIYTALLSADGLTLGDRVSLGISRRRVAARRPRSHLLGGAEPTGLQGGGEHRQRHVDRHHRHRVRSRWGNPHHRRAGRLRGASRGA